MESWKQQAEAQGRSATQVATPPGGAFPLWILAIHDVHDSGGRAAWTLFTIVAHCALQHVTILLLCSTTSVQYRNDTHKPRSPGLEP